MLYSFNVTFDQFNVFFLYKTDSKPLNGSIFYVLEIFVTFHSD